MPTPAQVARLVVDGTAKKATSCSFAPVVVTAIVGVPLVPLALFGFAGGPVAESSGALLLTPV